MRDAAEMLPGSSTMTPGDIRTAEDLSPVEVINPDATRALLIIAEHAGRRVPQAMRDATGPLGVPPESFDTHIAWDIGAAGVVRRLAEHLDVTAVLARYTRLLIDLNRPLGDPGSIPLVSDGTSIPWNRNLHLREREARAHSYYWPYHQAVEIELARLRLMGAAPLLLSVHSFAPRLRNGGAPRPWHAGVMASRDDRLATALLRKLAARGRNVALNQPYSGITQGYSLKLHGLAQGLLHAQLEIRQDLIATEAGQAEWADMLRDALTTIESDLRSETTATAE